MGLIIALSYIQASLIICLPGVRPANRCKKIVNEEFNLPSAPPAALTLVLVSTAIINAAVVYSSDFIYGDSDFTYSIYGLGASLVTPVFFGLILYTLTIRLASKGSDVGGTLASFTSEVSYGVYVFPAIFFVSFRTVNEH